MRRSLFVILPLAALALAGCVDPRENRAPTDAENDGGGAATQACAATYVTIHYTGTPGEAEVRQALEGAGFTWEEEVGEDAGVLVEQTSDLPESGRIAYLFPPEEGVFGVASHEPGTSGPDLVLSFRERPGGIARGDDIAASAVRAAEAINQTAPEAEVVQWVSDAWSSSCSPLDVGDGLDTQAAAGGARDGPTTPPQA